MLICWIKAVGVGSFQMDAKLI